MRKISSAIAVGALVLGTLSITTPATADDPMCMSTHCYSLSHYSTPNFDQFGLEISTKCLHTETPPNSTTWSVATNEIWTFPTAGGWFETGYVRGVYAGGDPESFYRLFWAEYNPATSSFHSHFINWAYVNNWENFTFSKESDNRWGVYRGGLGGTKVGTTTTVSPAAAHFQVGAETNDSTTTVSNGKSRYLMYHGVNDPYWSVPSPWQKTNTSGVYVGTITGNDYEHWSTKNVCPGSTPPPSSARAVPTETDIVNVAKSFSAGNGEKSPKVEIVRTKRNAAESLVAGKPATMDSNPDVVLVKMTGSFEGHSVTRPEGFKAPKGTVLTMTFDSKNGQLTDWSLGSKDKNLKTLGTVKKIS